MCICQSADNAAACVSPNWIGKGLTCVCFKRKGTYERICISLTPLQASGMPFSGRTLPLSSISLSVNQVCASLDTCFYELLWQVLGLTCKLLVVFEVLSDSSPEYHIFPSGKFPSVSPWLGVCCLTGGTTWKVETENESILRCFKTWSPGMLVLQNINLDLLGMRLLIYAEDRLYDITDTAHADIYHMTART